MVAIVTGGPLWNMVHIDRVRVGWGLSRGHSNPLASIPLPPFPHPPTHTYVARTLFPVFSGYVSSGGAFNHTTSIIMASMMQLGVLKEVVEAARKHNQVGGALAQGDLYHRIGRTDRE